MTVGVPDTGNSSWLLTYKNKDDKEKLERFETGETIENRKNPRQADKKPKEDKKGKKIPPPKFNRGEPSDEANEAMWREGKTESKLRDAEEKHQKTLKEVKDTDPEKVRSAQNDYRMQQLKERTDAKRRGKEDEKTERTLHTMRDTIDTTDTKHSGRNNPVNEKNIQEKKRKVEGEKRQQRQAERTANETRKLEEEKRVKPRTDTRANPVEGGKEIDAKGDSSKKLEEHSRDIDRQRTQAKQRYEAQQTSKPKPKIDARTSRSAVPKTEAESKRRGRQEWDKLPKEAKVPKDHVTTGDYQAPSVPKTGNVYTSPDKEGKPKMEEMFTEKSIQILKTLVKLSKLRSGLRKAKEERAKDPFSDGKIGQIKERLSNPTAVDAGQEKRYQGKLKPSYSEDKTKLPKRFVPPKEGGTMSERSARVPKQAPINSTTIPKADKEGKIPKDSKYKPIDSIGTKDSRIEEIRSNIKQRRSLTTGKKQVTDSNTGKKETVEVPKWDKQVAEKERRGDTQRFSGDKIGNEGVDSGKTKLRGRKGKEIYDKLEGQGAERSATRQSGERSEEDRKAQIERYRKTEADKQSASDSFKKGLKGGAKRKYETSDDEGKEAMFKKWKRSQGQKKKSDDIAEKLSSLNL
jgi:hypothetical protein